ncbi:MAG: hypothetical protein ACRDL7_08915 [Gaiellaceae bacterium]
MNGVTSDKNFKDQKVFYQSILQWGKNIPESTFTTIAKVDLQHISGHFLAILLPAEDVNQLNDPCILFNGQDNIDLNKDRYMLLRLAVWKDHTSDTDTWKDDMLPILRKAKPN